MMFLLKGQAYHFKYGFDVLVFGKILDLVDYLEKLSNFEPLSTLCRRIITAILYMGGREIDNESTTCPLITGNLERNDSYPVDWRSWTSVVWTICAFSWIVGL